MFLYGNFENLVAEAYNQFSGNTVKPGVQLTLRPLRITDMFSKALVFAAIGLVHVAIPSGLLAQGSAGTVLRPVRITTPPKLDGILDDEAWAGEPLPLDGWSSYNPMRGEAPAEKTQVWIGYDNEALYFAFRCLDTQPEKIRTTISRRDNAFGDDWVGLSLDSSRAGQLAYHLFVNPSGIQMDALQSGSTGEDFAPDWVWQSAGHVGADGWSAEIRVPLENIRFRSGTDVRMGVLFWRRLSRTGVSASWPEMTPGKWVFESNAIVSFDELQSRRLFEMIPSATFSGNQARSERARWNSTRARGDVGVSVKYGLTSAVTLDATVNPDFSQVESDAFEVEVNQRFPVFFSEKRPFFMEGLGLFNLAG
ncbi:MAG: carbohydrate binding family 9 domain-containing protein, partial [Planctomycetaceae bacterium]|nr:carbohydrate binding family 9 domain-containing protein [Planctomycetaceae bacterium]